MSRVVLIRCCKLLFSIACCAGSALMAQQENHPATRSDRKLHRVPPVRVDSDPCELSLASFSEAAQLPSAPWRQSDGMEFDWLANTRVGYDSGFVIASRRDLDLATGEFPYRLKITGWGQLRHSILGSHGPNPDQWRSFRDSRVLRAILERWGRVIRVATRLQAHWFDVTWLDGAPISSASLDISPGDIGWLFRSQTQFAF